MQTPPNRFSRIAAALLLGALTACSGGGGGDGPSTPAKTIADTLTYTNPSSGTYQLVKDSSSTASHLVLNLVNTNATPTSGVGFYLAVDSSKATWSNVGSDKVASPLFSNTILKTKASGDSLQAAVYQKGTTAPVTPGTASVLAQVALDLKAGLPVNTSITLSAPAGKAQLLNPPTNPTVTTPITIAVGTLSAN